MAGARAFVAVLYGTLITLLGARFVVCLIRADPESGVVKVFGTITDPFVAPFEGVLGIQHVPIGGAEHSSVDIGALVAMAGYSLLFALIVAVLGVFRARRAGVAG